MTIEDLTPIMVLPMPLIIKSCLAEQGRNALVAPECKMLHLTSMSIDTVDYMFGRKTLKITHCYI